MAFDFYALCRSGTPEEAEKAVEAEAHVNARDKDGVTPLTYATGRKNPDIIKTPLRPKRTSTSENDTASPPAYMRRCPMRIPGSL